MFSYVLAHSQWSGWTSFEWILNNLRHNTVETSEKARSVVEKPVSEVGIGVGLPVDTEEISSPSTRPLGDVEGNAKIHHPVGIMNRLRVHRRFLVTDQLL